MKRPKQIKINKWEYKKIFKLKMNLVIKVIIQVRNKKIIYNQIQE